MIAWLSVAAFGAEPFEAWVAARAEAEKGKVTTSSRVDLDGDGRPDDIACLNFEESYGEVTVVSLASGERLASPLCLEADTRKRTLYATDMMPGGMKFWSYQIRAGQPVLASEGYDGRYSGLRLNWLEGTFVYTDHGYPSGEETQTEGSLIIATTATVPAPRTWVTWQKKPHGGAQDAALQISARPDGNGGAVLTLSATDDVKIPLAGTSPKDVLKADHFELWIKQGGQRRQLGVAEGPSGPVVVRFTAGDEAPLPTFRQSSAGLQVELPASAFAHGDPYLDLTVVFSDADSAEGQEALLSTVSVRPGPETADSRLVILPDGGTAPRGHWKVLDDKLSLQELAEQH